MSTYEYRAVNEEQKAIINDLNSMFTALENYITIWVPSGRQRSVALTNLEQASMWANKGVSHNPSVGDMLGRGSE